MFPKQANGLGFVVSSTLFGVVVYGIVALNFSDADVVRFSALVAHGIWPKLVLILGGGLLIVAVFGFFACLKTRSWGNWPLLILVGLAMLLALGGLGASNWMKPLAEAGEPLTSSAQAFEWIKQLEWSSLLLSLTFGVASVVVGFLLWTSCLVVLWNQSSWGVRSLFSHLPLRSKWVCFLTCLVGIGFIGDFLPALGVFLFVGFFFLCFETRVFLRWFVGGIFLGVGFFWFWFWSDFSGKSLWVLYGVSIFACSLAYQRFKSFEFLLPMDAFVVWGFSFLFLIVSSCTELGILVSSSLHSDASEAIQLWRNNQFSWKEVLAGHLPTVSPFALTMEHIARFLGAVLFSLLFGVVFWCYRAYRHWEKSYFSSRWVGTFLLFLCVCLWLPLSFRSKSILTAPKISTIEQKALQTLLPYSLESQELTHVKRKEILRLDQLQKGALLRAFAIQQGKQTRVPLLLEGAKTSMNSLFQELEKLPPGQNYRISWVTRSSGLRLLPQSMLFLTDAFQFLKQPSLRVNELHVLREVSPSTRPTGQTAGQSTGGSEPTSPLFRLQPSMVWTRKGVSVRVRGKRLDAPCSGKEMTQTTKTKLTCLHKTGKLNLACLYTCLGNLKDWNPRQESMKLYVPKAERPFFSLQEWILWKDASQRRTQKNESILNPFVVEALFSGIVLSLNEPSKHRENHGFQRFVSTLDFEFWKQVLLFRKQLTKEETLFFTKKNRSSIALCYMSARVWQVSLPKKFKVFLSLYESGKLKKVRFASKTLGNTQLGKCVANALKEVHFPREIVAKSRWISVPNIASKVEMPGSFDLAIYVRLK